MCNGAVRGVDPQTEIGGVFKTSPGARRSAISLPLRLPLSVYLLCAPSPSPSVPPFLTSSHGRVRRSVVPSMWRSATPGLAICARWRGLSRRRIRAERMLLGPDGHWTGRNAREGGSRHYFGTATRACRAERRASQTGRSARGPGGPAGPARRQSRCREGAREPDCLSSARPMGRVVRAGPCETRRGVLVCHYCWRARVCWRARGVLAGQDGHTHRPGQDTSAGGESGSGPQ
jgi:hypothetical protein